MALATACGLSAEFSPLILAPPGPALAEAARLGFATAAFSSSSEFLRLMHRQVAAHRAFAFLATGLQHSLACLGWNAIYRRRVAHLHMVHGGADESLSYGRKRILNYFPVRFVAVSDFVRERLLAHRVRASQISVIENFLADSDSRPQRGTFGEPGIQRAVVISRVDPIKKVDLLLDAIAAMPQLQSLPIRVLGAGWDLERLAARAAHDHPNVSFPGFRAAAAEELAASDLLIHLCPTEPFGLAILEAMAAGVPVLAPNAGGAGALVEDGVTGFHFRAGDPRDLAGRIAQLRAAPAALLNRVTEAARALLRTRFSPAGRVADYRLLLSGVLS